VWRLVEEHDPGKTAASAASDPHLRLRHKTIKRVTTDLERMQFNTAIAAMMEYVNHLTAEGPPTREDLETLVKLVAPYAPHMADEAWERLGGTGFVIEQRWPTFEDALTRDAVVNLGVQVNGKLRGNLEVARDAPEAEVREKALAVSNVAKHLEGKQVRKVIVVPGKIVNIVVAE
jgi:leucyl-tRNA synthetase